MRNARKLDLILVEAVVGDEWIVERESHLLCAPGWLGVVSIDKEYLDLMQSLTINR